MHFRNHADLPHFSHGPRDPLAFLVLMWAIFFACVRPTPCRASAGIEQLSGEPNRLSPACRLVDPKLTAEIRRCEPLLETAETVPVAAKCGHTPSFWCKL